MRVCFGIVFFLLQVKHLHACEWNPDSLVALRFNLAHHRVAGKCTVHAGDNRRTVHTRATALANASKANASNAAASTGASSSSTTTTTTSSARSGPVGLRGCADRVNLGLIPSSSQGWPLACAALRAHGGWLHVHDNVHEGQVAAWAAALAATVARLGADEGEGREAWAVVVAHVEKVKSYAPRVLHVVADLFVYQRSRDDDGALPYEACDSAATKEIGNRQENAS
jgi:tRNA G37 N-methylase Trm5